MRSLGLDSASTKYKQFSNICSVLSFQNKTKLTIAAVKRQTNIQHASVFLYQPLSASATDNAITNTLKLSSALKTSLDCHLKILTRSRLQNKTKLTIAATRWNQPTDIMALLHRTVLCNMVLLHRTLCQILVLCNKRSLQLGFLEKFGHIHSYVKLNFKEGLFSLNEIHNFWRLP